jgi:MarR family 2-MHQ and catechol resistance regulon transcriptional repressor
MGTKYKGTKKETESLDAFIKLNRASETVLGNTKSIFSKEGLTESQFSVLEVLYHCGDQSQLDIGKKILKTRGNITFVIRNLEKNGYIVRRKTDADKRFYSVNLTKNGRDVIEKIFPDHVRQIVSKMSILSSNEQQELGRLCKKLGLSGGAI